MNKEIQKYIEEQIVRVMRQKMDECLQRAVKKIPILQEILEADTFYPNIPEADHSPSADQPLMKLNNQKITKQWASNHIGITDTQNYGKHTRIDMKNFGEEEKPIPGFGLLYFLNGALQLYDPSGRKINLEAQGSIGGGGYIKIPVGNVFWTAQWGQDGGRNGKVVNFHTAFEDQGTPLVIPRRTNSAKNLWVVDGATTRTTFKVGMDGGTSNFNWAAFGR